MVCSNASIDNCQVLYIESFIKDTVNEKKKCTYRNKTWEKNKMFQNVIWCMVS